MKKIFYLLSLLCLFNINYGRTMITDEIDNNTTTQEEQIKESFFENNEDKINQEYNKNVFDGNNALHDEYNHNVFNEAKIIKESNNNGTSYKIIYLIIFLISAILFIIFFIPRIKKLKGVVNGN